MLRKSWKHLSLIMKFLFFIVIGVAVCSFGCDGTQKNKTPVKIYRVTEPEQKDTLDTANPLSLTKDDVHNNPSSQEDAETTAVHASIESVPTSSADRFPNNTTPNLTPEELVQPDSDMSQQNGKELAKQKVEQAKGEIREARTLVSRFQSQLTDLEARNRTAKKNIDLRNYALAEKLNSFSAGEQQAYFDQYRSKHSAAKEFIRSTFFEKVRAEAASQDYSEQMEVILTSIEQTIMGKTGEEWVRKHIKELRKYGFKPKF